ncbi:MAG TPA: LamG domain-containing protein [Verrucomicrobia bacterium]|nr:LamG domain-containing protein [Verrucomicrobiota bacterium]HOP96335.1 LamG domain-containing protein [Verrucomicrobiota bacterium]
MKRHFCHFGFAFLLFTVLFASRAVANVHFTLSLWHGYDFFYPNASLIVTNPAPVTYHRIESPSGWIWRNAGSDNNGSSGPLADLETLLEECTNGVWKLYLNKDDASETVYYFSVSVSGVGTGEFGDVSILYPEDGSSGLAAEPTFHFTGPDHSPWIDLYVADQAHGLTWYSATIPGSSTNWAPSGPLAPGENLLSVIHRYNGHPGISMTVPTNSAGEPLSGWSSSATLYTYGYSSFNVKSGGSGGGGHRLLAHYSFEDGSIFATDVSGNENHVGSVSSTGGGTRYPTNEPAIGDFSAYFDNNGGAGGGWLNPPTKLLATLAGSFTVSLWVQTTEVYGEDDDWGLFGNAGLVSAFTGPGDNWVVPMAITGSKLAFVTGGFPEHTLHSSVSITNEGLVHVAVTRDRLTGEKRIYINGVLDAEGMGSTELLDSADGLEIGYNNGTGFKGVMDDIQIYSGVLSPAEIAFLYANPGSTVPDAGGSELGEAVDAPELMWTTGGDADWFAQTGETHDGADAAQSGPIDRDQSTWIETTVQGPGTLSFWWNVSSEDDEGFDFVEFTIDETFEAMISGEWGWDYYEVYLEPGTHTLRWTYWKDSEFASGADAAWLDEVRFVPDIEVSLRFSIERSRTPDGEFFLGFPLLEYVSVEAVTSHEIESPNGLFQGSTDGSSSINLASLQEVLDEVEAGVWRLYINRGSASERIYTFTASVTGIEESDLPPVEILSPQLGSTVPPETGFSWTGPSGYTSLFVNSFLSAGGASGGMTNLQPDVMEWTPPNPLVEGTNGLLVSYRFEPFGGAEFTDPVDPFSNPLTSWNYSIDLASRATTRFIVGSGPAVPVTILNPARAGAGISFSLMTESGRSHTVQSATNLSGAVWTDVTNFVGDGGLIQLQLPIGPEPQRFFRVRSQ